MLLRLPAGVKQFRQVFHKTGKTREGGFVETMREEENGAPGERWVGERPGLGMSALWAFVGLLAFVGIFNFLLPDLGDNLNEGGLITLGLIFSLVPALLWLVVFYRLDEREPEPKQVVLAVYGVALLLAAAVYPALVQGLFQLDRWLYVSWWGQLFGEVLVTGMLGMGIVYAAVRVVVYLSPEFDERLDGVIYGMAAALGVATVVNFLYVLRHGGVDLDIGSIRMVVNAMGYASFGGVLGYFLGQARFEQTPAYYVPGGLGLAALLTGLYFFLLDRTATDALGTNGGRDLLLAAFLALLAVLLLTYLINRTNEETGRVAGLAPSGHAWVPLAPVATVTGVMEATGAGKRLETGSAPAAGGPAVLAGDAPPRATYLDASAAEEETYIDASKAAGAASGPAGEEK
jgi:RsiW-degrading membrane proteinase PrsW (M82 family)